MSDLPLFHSPLVELVRRGRHVLARLSSPCKVLSTCVVNGGLRSDVRFLVNHQSCEPAKHQERFEFMSELGAEGYQKHVCEELGLPPSATAVLGTAAAMQYQGLVTHDYEDLRVTAVVTGGVTGNSGCAGDPAAYDERDGAWKKTGTPSTKAPGTQGGTINTLLFLSSPLSDGGLTRAAVTMTEAKTSALNELAVGSRSSWRLATGTGTDQFAIACPLNGSGQRTWTGKHTKAGELIGLAVREATLEALRWQNGLEASYTRSVLHALGRFGLTEERLKEGLKRALPEQSYKLSLENWNPIIFEPQLAAAAYAFAAVLDRVLFGTIGASSARESLLHQAALMSAGLSTRPEDFPSFRRALISSLPSVEASDDQARIRESLELAIQAIAQGWQAKWRQS